MRNVFVFVCLACAVFAAEPVKIIPVKSWPRSITTDAGLVVNPSPETCIRAGYRLLPAESPTVLEVKRVAAVEVTNVPPDRVRFVFDAKGTYRGTVWLDAPATNAVVEVKR